MKPSTQRGGLALALLLTIQPGLLFAQTPKDKPGKDKPAAQKPPEAKPDPATVARQKAAAEANWKRVVEESPRQIESAHLIILAPSANKNLAQTGEYLEKAYGLAAKALRLTPDELWPGKLTVYLANERGQYKSFMRSVLRKRAEDDDRGGYSLEGDHPCVVAGPPVKDLEQEAANEIAQALLMQKAKVKLPEWLVFGFGRATVLRVSSTAIYAREKQAARVLVVAKKRTSRDVWSGSDSLLIGEASILRGSLVDFLAYSGATQKFPEFVTGYRARDKKILNPTTENAFTRADINPDVLEKTWRAWLAR